MPYSLSDWPCRRTWTLVGWCQASDVLGESHGRQIDQIGALGKADGPPGSPVHGDGTIWVNAADRLCRLLGVEMALDQGWVPSLRPASGRGRRVADLLERDVRARVPRIPAPAGARNKIAECGSAMRAPRVVGDHRGRRPGHVSVGRSNSTRSPGSTS